MGARVKRLWGGLLGSSDRGGGLGGGDKWVNFHLQLIALIGLGDGLEVRVTEKRSCVTRPECQARVAKGMESTEEG